MAEELELSVYSYKGVEVHYRSGTKDEKVLAHSFIHDIFFPEIPSFKPSKKPVIIDVGAHIGTFSVLCAIKYPEASIYAYEACHDTFRVLEKNKSSNNFTRIHPFHKAVAGVKGTAKLFHSAENGNWGHSITKALSSSFEEVTSTTLEDITTENQIDTIDLIKLNCEGAEFEIIFNTPHDVIKKIGLGIILYHEDLEATAGNARELSALFKKLNFRIVTIKTGEKRGWLIVWNKRKYSWVNFIAKAVIRRLHA